MLDKSSSLSLGGGGQRGPLAIRAESKAESVEVFLADLIGIRSKPGPGAAPWSDKVRTLLVRGIGQRLSVNAMPAIGARCRIQFMDGAETFDATVMWRFLDWRIGRSRCEIGVGADGHELINTEIKRSRADARTSP
ncbi:MULTISPECIES: hypothetical protein [Streptomyces]|uniref:hypothetical protein n=1 Tax=Streptomyces TaxID=1883 RepID=UPI001E2D1A3B|nr:MULTISPECIES: hypothetical protein [Streptomyces]UFQ15344.1 hypothetical protein J2N69_10230 [Streptomyces huasconensis]WCL84948.1 hypothetical protein PPN52_10240 [Streptomyces sp. JCM 35825]